MLDTLQSMGLEPEAEESSPEERIEPHGSKKSESSFCEKYLLVSNIFF